MSNWIPAMDCSQYQGNIDWRSHHEQIVMIKIGGGDAGLYFDSKATQNYYGAKTAGKAVGGYWFAGGGNPVVEADYFVKGMSPLSENDVLALDFEIRLPNPVQWCEKFVNEVHAKTGVWPLLYVNASTFSTYDWSPVTKTCGLWIADYAVSPDNIVPVIHPYVMHQYTSSPYDKSAWFGTIEQFNKYGYHKPITTSPVHVEPKPIIVHPLEPSEPLIVNQPNTIPVPPAPVMPTGNPNPVNGTAIDVVVKPPTIESTVSNPVVVVTPQPTLKDHTIDVLVRSFKTYVAAMAAISAAGGLDVTHLSASKNITVAGLSAAVTALINIGIKLYQNMGTSSTVLNVNTAKGHVGINNSTKG